MTQASPYPAPRVRQLPETLVNRIAAGEVIERPAAAVRELVENALDAGARRIAVTLAGGGIDRIEVTDDGCGMSAECLALAVQRHCTSKLPDGDLVRIATLGFRGEALPSIGAAARLRIVSRTPEGAHAHCIVVQGGAVDAVCPAPGPPGTRVTVEDLFFATPARRKFLKSPRTEADHAEAALARLALAAPQTAFRLTIDGRLAFDLPAQDRRSRVLALLAPRAATPRAAIPGREAGQHEAEAMIEVSGGRDGLALSGFICAPMVSRPTPSGQSLVVNGRPVTDPVLRVAVRVAYRDVIAAGRHAVVALWLDVPPEELDVNVHPAKTELRFRQADQVRGLVISTLQRALATGAGHAAAHAGFRPAPWPSHAPGLQLSGGPGARAYSTPPPAQPGFAELPQRFGVRDFAAPNTAALPDAATHPLGAAIAQVLDTYIIAASGDGALILVDQHAAHERLTHEALSAQLLAGGVASQPLLLPSVVDLPPAQAARLADAAPALARLGLELESFGAGAVLVRALPAALGTADCQNLVRDIADELTESGQSVSLEQRLDAVVARMACHGSIRAGRRLNTAEMDALLRRMEATPRAATCSHGRPTFLKLSRAEIERMFGRS